MLAPRPRRTARLGRGLAVAAAGLLVVGGVAACSNRTAPVNKAPVTGSGVATSVDGVQQIVVTTGPDLRFHPATLIVHRGPVRLILRNSTLSAGGPPHNLHFSGLPVPDDIPTINAGQEATVTFDAPAPGRYPFVCTIHIPQGQRGVMIVKPGPAPS